MNLKIINVSHGSNEYPGNFTPKEIKIIKYNAKGKVLNLFSGSSKIGNVRVDFSHENATHKEDVFDFLYYHLQWDYYDTIIIDAPYNQKFGDKYRKLGNTPKQFIIFANTIDTTRLFLRIIKAHPKIIIFKSWNYYIPKGYSLKKGYMCYPGGYRKSTLLLILEKEGE